MKTERIVIHHSASKRDNTSRSAVAKWHREKGIVPIGYHYMILGNGTIESCRPEGWKGEHARGANHNSLGICLTGNFNEESPSPQQTQSLVAILSVLCSKYQIDENHIYGHRFVPGGITDTACPGNNLIALLPCIQNRVKWDRFGPRMAHYNAIYNSIIRACLD